MDRKSDGRQSPIHGLLLSKALERFRAELNEDDESLFDVASVEDLLQQTRAMEPSKARGSGLTGSLGRLEPILSHINDFAAVIAVCSGADMKTAGLVWGSLKMIFLLATPTGDTLTEVLNMLDELSLSLPRFRSYEDTLPMNKNLEAALIEVYAEMTCLCARTINFFRQNPHRPLLQSSWPKLDSDFKKTISRLKILSRTVDSEAEAIRLRTDSARNAELLEAMEHMKIKPKKQHDVLPCYYIPLGLQERLLEREDTVKELRDAFNTNDVAGSSQCVVLHGIGGVGKTRIALEYANSSRSRFDAIFWISADNNFKLAQGFSEVSKRLTLSRESDEQQDTDSNIARVKAWLVETSCKWLIVFDNADNPDILIDVLPSGATGSILITSRDFTAGFGFATKNLHVQPFSMEAGATTLLTLTAHNPRLQSDRESALKIAEALGGLPLAINQMSGFILQQRLALQDFLSLYEKNSARINKRKVRRTDYEHTLSTKLLAFFDPDKIHESILKVEYETSDDVDFSFLHDDMDFLDAQEILLRAALIDRSSEEETLSVHRLIQTAVMNRLDLEEQVTYFDRCIKMLSNSFPNTWNAVTSHQFSNWSKYEKCLPHVMSLMRLSQKHNLPAGDPKLYAELVLRCSWYLYERENYTMALSFIQFALDLDNEPGTLMYASIHTLRGLIELDLLNVEPALENFTLGLTIRQGLLDPNDAFIASSLNAISLAYTELGDLDKAVEAGDKAIDIRLRTQSDRIGNSYSNMASTLLRMGKADEAEEMLKRCPSLKNFTDETFLRSGNPRFSGDMILLGRIRQQQGRLDEALRLCSKALTFRKSLLGNGLKTCDSLYHVATILELRGDLDLACTLLEESISITKTIPHGEGYEARANFVLARLYKSLNSIEKSEVSRLGAEDILRKRSNESSVEQASQEAYDRLVPWMLW